MEASNARAARQIGVTLFVTQSLASAAFIANVTVNAIVGEQLSGTAALAGLPTALILAGAALSAYPAGRFMQRVGRRPGLAIGFLLGMAGMALDGLAVVLASLPLFMGGLILLGMARGITDQSRYAAADAVPLSQRARAISMVVFAGTVGAVGGPALVGPLGQVSLGLGLPELAGPMLGGALLFVVGACLIELFLRPDPRDLALRLAAADETPGTPPAGPGRSLAEVLGAPTARAALLAMVVGQTVMTLIMSVTSLHMHHHDHGLGSISLVIGAHTLGMFGLSMVTGWMADRLGRPATIAIGALLLIGGALIAPTSLLTPWLALALFLVGLGWNLCYIGGSSLLSDELGATERGRIQGGSDLLVNVGSATGSLSSGVILAAAGFTALALFGAVLALIPLAVAGAQIRAARAAAAAN